MQRIVRTIMQSFLFEKKVPTVEEIKKIPAHLPEKVCPVFVTLYDGDVIVGSAGRLYPTKDTFIEEFIDNTIGAMEDMRFKNYTINPEMAKNIVCRIDTFENTDRRMLHHPDDIDPKNEGMIIICRKQKKVGVILPKMLPDSLSGEDIYHALVKKIDLNLHEIGKGDLILYGLKTHIFRD